MVLTPYRAQIDCCRKENIEKPVEITTIHGSQGQYIAGIANSNICTRGVATVNREIFNGNKFSKLAESMKN